MGTITHFTHNFARSQLKNTKAPNAYIYQAGLILGDNTHLTPQIHLPSEKLTIHRKSHFCVSIEPREAPENTLWILHDGKRRQVEMPLVPIYFPQHLIKEIEKHKPLQSASFPMTGRAASRVLTGFEKHLESAEKTTKNLIETLQKKAPLLRADEIASLSEKILRSLNYQK